MKESMADLENLRDILNRKEGKYQTHGSITYVRNCLLYKI